MYKNTTFRLKAYLRTKGIMSKKYTRLQEFKNAHLGKRCFIVATGPSLKVSDLNKLKNEITFGMNSIYLAYKDTEWRPTYYAIQDPLVYEKIHHELRTEDFKVGFFGSIIKKNKPKGDNWYEFPLDLLNHQIPRAKLNTKFSDDIVHRVYSGYNIAYTTLQIAVYMGFKDIYLIGADCNYLGEKKYFANDENRGAEKYFTKQFLTNNSDKFLYAYTVAKDYCDSKNIKIYNATRGGLLEVFPRVDFDDLF